LRFAASVLTRLVGLHKHYKHTELTQSPQVKRRAMYVQSAQARAAGGGLGVCVCACCYFPLAVVNRTLVPSAQCPAWSQ
jgi:hypothetical protein